MIKISNGIKVFQVTKGAFEGVYKKQGFKICDEKGKASNDQEKSEKPKADPCRTILEKPISQWTKAETRKVAECKKVDISNVKTFDEAKTLIKAAIDAERDGNDEPDPEKGE